MKYGLFYYYFIYAYTVGSMEIENGSMEIENGSEYFSVL